LEKRPKDHDVDILLRPRAAYALVVLYLAKRPLTAHEFADALGYSSPGAVALREYLVWLGMVVVETDPMDRLFLRISLTDKGRREAQRYLEARKAAHGDDWDKTRHP
jgi:DNA-binding MarR family transcriptional regulator